MKPLFSKLFSSYLALTLAVSPAYAAEKIFTEPAASSVPTISLEAAKNKPVFTTPVIPTTTTTDFLIGSSPLSPSTPQTGNLSTQTTTSTQTAISTQATISNSATPATTCTTLVCGIPTSAILGGTVFIEPNLTLTPGISKVSYFLNGASSGTTTQTPFYWGGLNGFDTTTLANGAYRLHAIAKNSSGTTILDTNVWFNISNTPPSPPVISAVTATGITSSAATIMWTTDQASDSQAQYRVQGTTTWLTTTLDSTLVMSHSVMLSGLNPSTVYEYQVLSRNQAGILATEATISNFTTLNVPPPAISAVTAANITASGALITWATDQASDSQAQYRVQGTTTWLTTTLDSTLVMSHSVMLSGLNPSTVYEYQVLSRNQAGTLATEATISNFTTLMNTTPPPVISTVSTANVTSTGATIIWTTDKASDSQVQYRVQGTTTWLTTILDSTLATNHSVTLSGLSANTVYEYQVLSRDQAGDLATEPTTSNFLTLVQSTTPSVTGLRTGDIVEGIIQVAPDLSTLGPVQKVSYYLNSASSGSYTQGPFMWGGPNGFNTTTLANGGYRLHVIATNSSGTSVLDTNVWFTVSNVGTQPALLGLTAGATVSGRIFVTPNPADFGTIKSVQYLIEQRVLDTETKPPFTLGGANGLDTSLYVNDETRKLTVIITDNTGVHTVTVNFRTNNVAPPGLGIDFTGIKEYATVSGVVNIGPNLALHPDITNVTYWLNLTSSGNVSTSPFLWGGPTGTGTTGFDTTTLPNGTYVLGMSYTDSTGTHLMFGTGGVELDMIFTVKN